MRDRETDPTDIQPAEVPLEQQNDEKAEWVALMCVIAEHDRDLYRQLRAEAWEGVEESRRRAGPSTKHSN